MRYKDFDKMKCITMYMVVLGHVLYFLNGREFCNSNLVTENILAEYIRCIQMPAFMLISGFFFKKSVNKRKQGFLLKNIAKNIIGTAIPMIVWGISAYLIEEFGEYSITTFFSFLWNKFWYFKVLLILKFLFSFSLIFKNKNKIYILIIVCIMLNSMPSDNNFIQLNAMFPFFAIGYEVSESKYEKILMSNINRNYLICSCILWCGLFWFGKHLFGIYDIALSQQLLNYKGIVSLFYSISLKTLGVYLFFEIVKILPDILNWKWGQYTIFVYPFHCIVVDLLYEKGVFNYVKNYNPIYISIRSIILASLLFLLSNILAGLIKENKFFALAFLGKFPMRGAKEN